jgi:hypothetical protein
VKLSTTELANLLRILEKIDRGLIHPRMPDRIGRFLRQYGSGRKELDRTLTRCQVERRADAAVSGRALGAIEIHSLLEPEVSLLGFPLGEVAGTLAISEQLGGFVNLTMWLNAPTANTVYNLLRQNPALRLTGDYRWTPSARLTPGEAHLDSAGEATAWQHARCLKAVADDLFRPPHALEYVLDYRIGPPSLKYFRCVCALKGSENWEVLPGLTRSRTLEVATVIPEVKFEKGERLYTLLIYCEPWSRAWTIVEAIPIDAEDALAHSITWADFQRELSGLAIEPAIIAGSQQALRAAGLASADFGHIDLTRALLPVARDVLRSLRGSV